MASQTSPPSSSTPLPYPLPSSPHLAGALPHVLHVGVGDVGVGRGQRVVQLLGGVHSQEQHQGLVCQGLEGGAGGGEPYQRNPNFRRDRKSTRLNSSH